ncbi:rRNA-binding ribosome biosynthesis protein utp25 [Microbotryomycetes sp. JL221]|nr:rRNA-binding ribosome biosynthesis protein utp25 [Microbotryomycetes sp. JL221]
MPKPMTEQSPTVKLLTLINVDNAGKRAFKRRKTDNHGQPDWYAIAKQSKLDSSSRLQSNIRDKAIAVAQRPDNSGTTSANDQTRDVDLSDNDEQDDATQHNAYDSHWSSQGTLLSGLDLPSTAKEDADVDDSDNVRARLEWTRHKHRLAGLGPATLWQLATHPQQHQLDGDTSIYNSKLLDKLTALPNAKSAAVRDGLLQILSSYRDVFFPRTTLQDHTTMRATLAMHAMNHVTKLRTRVLKNNEHLARLAADAPGNNKNFKNNSDSTRNTQDQGFTRPKVLILVPFRNSAFEWMNLLTTMSTTAQTVEGKQRFDAEYSLPQGATDKLADHPEQYAPDHVATFKGNIDDSFRVGIKLTRKTLKLFAEFYSCDVILASPLGLRTTIEKDDDSDFLSSIEMLIVDQMDVMTMQNWEHVQFVMDRLNKIPQDAHGCDFSRVKPWYLDGRAAYLRQSVFLSAYETPEMRNMFSNSLLNVAGKLKADVTYDGVLSRVPRGIKQVFTRFEVKDVRAEDDARFEHFKTKTIPALLKSAVSSSQTLIFVPSYFDFVRIKRYLKTLPDFSFTSISEYTPTPDVSRARGAFFAGKVSFLLVTERFHFFRRYRLRGAKTMVFYAPPDHADFYHEVVSFPFPRAGQHTLSDEPDVDASELSSHILFSKFDLLRLSRIVGSADASKMVRSGAEATKFTFVE